LITCARSNTIFEKWIVGFFALTPAQGADTSIYLASAPDVAGMPGNYFVKREAVWSAPIAA
jgi:hypothetical protein